MFSFIVYEYKSKSHHPARPMKTANLLTKLNGQRGEYLTMAKLAELGYLPAKLDDGSTMVDIAVINPDTLDSVCIQVKSVEEMWRNNPYWMMSEKNERVYDKLWYVLVNLTPAGPEFYVFHSLVVGPRIAKDHVELMATPKRDGTSRKDSGMRKFYPTQDELAAARDAFGQMFA
jgi:hypothetical protein